MNPNEDQPQAATPDSNPPAVPQFNNQPAPAEPVQPPAPSPEPQVDPTPMMTPAPEQPVVVAAPQPVAAVAPVQPAPSGSKGLAIASLVLGILGFLTGFIGIGILLGLVAVVLGVIVLVKHHAGKGMAIAGLITGGLAVVFGGLFFLISLTALSGIQDKALESLCEAQARDGVALDARCSEL